MSKTRALRRARARLNMKRDGVQRMNDRTGLRNKTTRANTRQATSDRSFFASRWRAYAALRPWPMPKSRKVDKRTATQ